MRTMGMLLGLAMMPVMMARPLPLQMPHNASDITQCGTTATTPSVSIEETNVCLEMLPLRDVHGLPEGYDGESNTLQRRSESKKPVHIPLMPKGNLQGLVKGASNPLELNAVLDSTPPKSPPIQEQAQERMQNFALLLIDWSLSIICVTVAWAWAYYLRRAGNITTIFWMLAFAAFINAAMAPDKRASSPPQLGAFLVYMIFHVSYCQLRLGNTNGVRAFVLTTAALTATFFAVVQLSGLRDFLEANFSIRPIYLLPPIHLVVFDVTALARSGQSLPDPPAISPVSETSHRFTSGGNSTA
ncbi:hypothetical protein TW65_05514 [Stemphylium lycopersici]|uniref:Uncharacterized protein n=1 Tax=Stemphylium lycopersici TaxID=183478 RepID=A0A364MYT5_STELY|nr:hypothetical protein TW65_05514 [Stemphylium lycopersici]RAR07359.1 hypothetical protein DDE83_006541 [Stemphylium lycopersici]